jgi:dephospho-CoA kinase
LTGGVGMGKSAAADILRSRGLTVIDTDVLARQIVEAGQPALAEIRAAFGETMIGQDGNLRRGELARLVFSDNAARERLERITHPRIRQLWKTQLDTWRTESRAVAVVVIPLLFETAAENEMSATVCIACSAGTQRDRLQQRGWTPEQCAQRVAAQWTIERKIARADFVVWTEGDLSVVGDQLARILRSLGV